MALILNDFGKLNVLVPRSLCSVSDEINLEVNQEGFSPVEISWEKGFISAIKSNPNGVKTNKILLPRFVEPHAHLDKSFSWTDYPNLKSNYKNALLVNLEEHDTRTSEKVITRAENSIELAIKNGYRAIRTHVDTYPSQDIGIWSGLFHLQEKYSKFLKLQFVALAPMEYWTTIEGEKLAQIIKKNDGIIGGVIVPPLNKKKFANLIRATLLLADKYQLEVDFHIDESSTEPGAGIKLLIKILNQLEIKVPITCSHLSSISLLRNGQINSLALEIAERGIKVVALPMTNFWLLNRNEINTPLERPIAPIKQLQNSLVDVSIGSDNVQDSWYPFGNFDPFYLMSLAMPMLQLNPWDRLSLSALFNAPARLLNMEWDGVIKEGCPADFIVIDAISWADIFKCDIQREVFVKGNLFEK